MTEDEGPSARDWESAVQAGPCGTVAVSAGLPLCCHSRWDSRGTAMGPRRQRETVLEGEGDQHPELPVPLHPNSSLEAIQTRAPGSWWPDLCVPLCGPGSSSGSRQLRLGFLAWVQLWASQFPPETLSLLHKEPMSAIGKGRLISAVA